jgi:hypothetical protein
MWQGEGSLAQVHEGHLKGVLNVLKSLIPNRTETLSEFEAMLEHAT